MDIEKILSGSNQADIVSFLRKRTTKEPVWENIVKEYEPTLHEIVEDKNSRKDKIHSDGSKDEAARLTLGLEKLLSKRMTEFMFAIPVKRIYSEAENDAQAAIIKTLEKIYKVAHIDMENKRRGLSYFASCEALTIWYVKRCETPHNLYGFPCKYKLKCKTFSQMDGVKLYPLIDEYGEMYAMSMEYRKKVKDEYVTYFECYTAKRHCIWKKGEKDNAEWEQVRNEDDLPIGKIPAVYIYRPKPIWDGLSVLRRDIEYTISRNSDVIAYNCAPILKVAGTIMGEEQKGETRRVYRVTEGGDVSYVSWAQSIAALQYHVQTLLNMFFMQAQIPDISFENMRNLGNIGYDARKMLFTDAHMKVGDESGAIVEFLERECNVIKAFLKEMNKESGDFGFKSADVDAVAVEQVITPFIQEDEALNIEKWSKAGGGIPVVSPLEAIAKAGISNDAEKTLADIMAYQLAMQGGGVNGEGEEAAAE